APAKGREQSAQNQTAQEAAPPTNGEPRKETIAPKEKTAQNAPNDARGANKENVASKATNEGREKSASTQIDNSGENNDNSRGSDAWEGLSGHPRPSSEQRASTLDAKLHPSGKSNIPQNQEKGNRTESREQADASRSNQGGFSDGENRQGRKPKEPVIERIINKAFPKSGKRGDAAKNFVANYAAALDADNWMKGLSLVEQDYTQQRDAILKDALEALKRGMGKGVDITKDPDTGRSIRTSNNEPWYRSWYKEYGRKPNKAELEQLAEAMVTGESFAHDVEGWQVVSAEDAAARQETKERLAEIDRYLAVCNDSRFKDKLKKAEKQWKAEARKGTFYQRVSRAVADFFQSAWHGSGALFDKFDLGYIGTGEGAQAHGYGVYASLLRGVAENYRKYLAGFPSARISYGGYEYRQETPNEWYKTAPGEEDEFVDDPIISRAFEALYNADGDKRKAIEDQESLREFYDENPDELVSPDDQEAYEAIPDVIDFLEAGDYEYTSEQPGALYQLEIPDDDVLLDKRKKLSQQSKTVRDGIKKAFAEVGLHYGDAIRGYKPDAFNEDDISGQEAYGILSNKLSNSEWGTDDKAASLLLNKHGIKGL
ncbi:MAG: hypothetical protein IJ521_03725, partial [Schwartzia sp.]|nr:hypothetical protein [Schwartzia sp. (in: firmicutes)]